jgi:hypothetical protein
MDVWKIGWISLYSKIVNRFCYKNGWKRCLSYGYKALEYNNG